MVQVIRNWTIVTVAGCSGLALANPAIADEPIPWTQDRIEAVVRVEVTYPGYPRPAVSTGFVVKGQGQIFVMTSTHGLQNEFQQASTVANANALTCTPLVNANLQLTQGETRPTQLNHSGCAIKLGHDVSLIPINDRPGGYPSLDLVARALRRWDRVYLAGYTNGYTYLDAGGNGPVSQLLDNPPDRLGVARIASAPGMSGGPLLSSDGKVIGVHRGGIQFVAGFSHFTRVEIMKPQLETVLGQILSDASSPQVTSDVIDSAAMAARFGDLVALQSLSSTKNRIEAWSVYQGRPATSDERLILAKLPKPDNLSPIYGVPLINLSFPSRAEVANFVHFSAAEKQNKCVINALIVNGELVCGGKSAFLEGARSGRDMTPTVIVLHYAVVTNLKGVLSFMTQANARASVHFVIDRDGAIVQLVPANKTAGHAGQGSWQGQSNLNSRSIGIEFMNAGRLTRRENGSFVTALGQEVPENEVIAIEADGQSAFWHRYSAQQFQSAEALAKTLATAYPISEIIGHCNINKTRAEPGPAFPQEEFGRAVLGRGVPACAYGG